MSTTTEDTATLYDVRPTVSFTGRPSLKVKAESPRQAQRFVRAQLEEVSSNLAKEAFQQVRNEQLNGGFQARVGHHVEVDAWGPASDVDYDSFPDATGSEPPMEKRAVADLRPETRDVGHAVYTGLTGEEDRYARENLPVFYLGLLEESHTLVAAPSAEAITEMLSNGTIYEFRAVAAESLEAARERYAWASYQYMTVANGATDEVLAQKGYESYDEAVREEGPYNVLSID
jgi:hypothetical protein